MPKWSEISTDFKVLSRLYEFIYVRKEQVWFTKLVESFGGELSRVDVSKAQDKMDDLCIMDGKWQKTPDGRWTRCLFIEDEVVDFAKTIFESTTEKPELKVN